MNYIEMMRQQEQDRVALIEDGTEYTYGRLVEMAENMSRDQKFFSEERCRGRIHLIRREKISHQLVELLAACERGEVPVMVPKDARQIPRERMIADVICTKNGTDDLENICMGVMTSGSTGEPKLFFRSYESWGDFFPIQNQIFGIHRDSRLFVQGSLAFTGNLNLYMAQFSIGATIVAQNKFNPREWEDMIARNRVDGVYLIPSKLMCMPRVMRHTHPAVQTIISGSQSLGKEDAQRLKEIFPNAKITLYYGASELNYITYVTDDQMTEQQDLIGRPFPGVQVEVREQEIYVTTPYHVVGVVCPYTLSDCGYLDEQGNLHFTGRSDDIINLRGRKVSAFRIEEILRSQPEVGSAAVLALPEDWRRDGYSERQHMILTAFITLRDNKQMEKSKSLRERLRWHLASYEMPDRIVVIADIPRKENGKIDKKRLQQIWETQQGMSS